MGVFKNLVHILHGNILFSSICILEESVSSVFLLNNRDQNPSIQKISNRLELPLFAITHKQLKCKSIPQSAT